MYASVEAKLQLCSGQALVGVPWRLQPVVLVWPWCFRLITERHDITASAVCWCDMEVIKTVPRSEEQGKRKSA